MVNLQQWIYAVEQGPLGRRLRAAMLGVALLGLGAGYNWLCFRNFNTPEAMDAAQVARNVSEGRGFTTQFIRPLSIHLVEAHHRKLNAASAGVTNADPAMLNAPHPDLANPPLYPLLLAGWMKIYTKVFPTDPDHRFWRYDGGPRRDPHDFFVSLFNQFLFLCALALTFFLARRLFDVATAWLTTALMLGCELMWRFSISGLPTMLLIVITLGLAWVLVRLENESREPKLSATRLVLLAAAAGGLAALGALTRYSYAWVILPVLVFLAFTLPQRRSALCLAALGMFGLLFVPWLVRNYAASGLPFGLASYAPVEASYIFPDYQLARSLHPDFNAIHLRALMYKWMEGMHRLLQDDLLRLGGSWAAPFFLVGLMLGFRNPALRRLRYFVVATLFLFLAVQALVRTQGSEDTKVVNGDNLIIVLFPLVLMFGVALFFILLEQINFAHFLFRHLAVGLFTLVMCLPMIDAFMPPRERVLAFPPYLPPVIRQSAHWMQPQELMMSDVPWAVAWYGDRQCVWLTLDASEKFRAINDRLKPVSGLYLTPRTMDSRILTDWVGGGQDGWGSFAAGVMRNEVPVDFPLRKAPKGYLPEQLFLTDRERWETSPQPTPPESP
jgi:hypothetical protein